MFLHLGEDVIILKSSILGIFDYEKLNRSVISQEFLKKLTKKKKEFICKKDKIKTFIVTEDKVYYSPISSSTLLKRSDQILNLRDEA